MVKVHLLIMALLLSSGGIKTSLEKRIAGTKGLIAYWSFAEDDGSFISKGKEKILLQPVGKKLQMAGEGPLSGKSIQLDGNGYLYIPYAETGLLNVKNNAVTVVAWVRWSGEQTGFVAGMWNEYEEGGKRQYGLFASLPYYNGANQVCGHISQTGKPTPPFPYSIDYSASKQEIPVDTWCCIAFTYDGKYIRSYLDGISEKREPELILHTKGFDGYPQGLTQSKNPYFFPDGIGDNGSDFTIGAVLLKSGMGNFFKGQIGGIAVFDRALTSRELKKLVR